MNYRLIKRLDAEREVAIKKWGATDRTSEILLNAVTEEVGEVAHAINHREGLDAIQQEIVEAIGVLIRLYEMVEEES
ncbi:hypothetical protein ES704_02075 [subsurface metagenome]|jgi:NTP pyrophosphatase (non-canonical NTP hydrolase)